MYFVQRERARSTSGPSGKAAAHSSPSSPGARKETAAARAQRQQREADREASGPVARTMRATAAFRLVDDSGQPLARRKGKAVLPDGREVAFTSGADGRFFIGGLEPGGAYTLVVEPEPSQDS